MAQYSVGTVMVGYNSTAVTGVGGTKFLANVQEGYAFKIKGDPVVYQVAHITDDTHLTLSAPYAGTTRLSAQYQITTDYTEHYTLAEVNVGDQDWPTHLTVETIRKIDTILAQLSARLDILEAK